MVVCLGDEVARFVTWANRQSMTATIFSGTIRCRFGDKQVKIAVVDHPAEVLAALARGDSALVSILWAIKLISERGDFRVEGLRLANQTVSDFVVIGKDPVALWSDEEDGK